MTDQIIEAIQRDLATFADPGTPVRVDDRGAMWQQGRTQLAITFVRGEEEFPGIVFNSDTFSYKGFFSSEHMADISTLAEVIVHTMAQPKWYVDAPAQLEDATEPAQALDLLITTATSGLPFAATRVVFVRGSAGAGKTFALREATIRQAERVAIGDAQPLFFYIDAQARALARFDDAVALLLQDLGAKFTYRALATLTRLGLVVPIIDGFDELIGVGGYGEAFDSLAKLLARLHGKGCLIASARSTFYQYRDFRQSAARYEKGRSLNFQITPLDILPWTHKETGLYLQEAGVFDDLGAASADEAVAEVKRRVGPQGEQFLRTPFFVATLAELIKQRTTVEPGRRVVSQIILHFIARERDKLRDVHDQPVVTEEGHRRFLEMLAEEMWWQGTRELDLTTVKVLSELAAEEISLSPSARVIFVERSPSYAFLESREHEGIRFLTFTHEYYYSYFLGSFMAGAVTHGENMDQLLARGRLSPLAGDEFAHALTERKLDAGAAARVLSHRRIASLTRELDLANAGSLFAGIMRHAPDSLRKEAVVNASFVQEDFSSTNLTELSFSQCEFLRCNLVNASWTEVRATGCLFSESAVDVNSTRLGGLRLTLGSELLGFILRGEGGDRIVYDPSEIIAVAQKVGVDTGESHGEPVEMSAEARAHVDLLHKFLRISSRLFYVSDDDLQNRGVLDQTWESLEKLLLDLDLMEFIPIQRRGPRNLVRRLKVPPIEIEKGEAGAASNVSVARLWEQLRSL